MLDKTPAPVLVTGGTGFLAQHTILQLLGRGMPVRATVRTADKGDSLRRTLAEAGADTSGLSISIADLMQPQGWEEAMRGVSGVLHLATPMQGDDVIAAAVDGTRRVIEAGAAAGITRMVLTSSGLAALQPGRAGDITERDWTDPDRKGTTDYARAKTLAERQAWALAQTHGMGLTTILPGAILGPRLGEGRPGWLALIGSMLEGKMGALPPIRLQMVDVRDLARLHIDALLQPEAAGQRYLAVGEAYSFQEVAAVLKAELGAAAARVSTREMPAWLLRLAGLVSAEAKAGAALLGARGMLNPAKARNELAWQARPVRQSIIDAARSLL